LRRVVQRLTAWRSALLGIVPQCVQPPPTSAWRSTTATRRLFLAAIMAAPSPPGPLPITMMSKCSMDQSAESLPLFTGDTTAITPKAGWSK
jgi:hypothetical protein